MPWPSISRAPREARAAPPTTGGISGAVTGKNGVAPTRARVSLYRRNASGKWKLFARTRVDSDGLYRFADLPPDLYRLGCQAPVYSAVYYPAKHQLGRAENIGVAAGEDMDRDLLLRRP